MNSVCCAISILVGVSVSPSHPGKSIIWKGLEEAGIDQSGVFKEFLEDICKRAFSTDFALFSTTADGYATPSPNSSVHEEHLQLFEFIGRILAKALYEGIVIDVPFAEFIYAKLIGRYNYLVCQSKAQIMVRS